MKKTLLLGTILSAAFAQAAYAVYCGSLTPTSPPPPPPADGRLPCSFYMAASGGNDANPGTSALPFATASKLQSTVAAATSLNKVACMKAGTYTNFSLTLGSGDAGETWETDPASPIGAAVIDDTFSVFTSIAINNTNVSLNGLKILNVQAYGVNGGNGGNPGSPSGTSITIENMEIGNIHWPGGGAMQSAGILLNNAKNSTIKHNYVHDSVGAGIIYSAFNAGETIDGGVVSDNFVDKYCTGQSDCGAIYANSRNSGAAAGHMTFSNNFTRNGGGPGIGSINGLYLDDHASGYTLTGNVVGPNQSGSGGSGILDHNGSSDIATGNIIDAASLGNWSQGVWFSDDGSPFTGSNFVNNLIIANSLGATGGYFLNGVATGVVDIHGNLYTDFGSGSINNSPDPSPTVVPPASLKCTGYLYTLDPSSSIFANPINFPKIKGGWGPAGFVPPTSTNHSCP